MTTKREVPLTGDTLAWVHGELAELKSRMALVQQAAEHSRAIASEASERTRELQARLEQYDAHGPAIVQAHEEIRVLKDQVLRLQDDIQSLRQSRDEAERKLLAEAERQRKEYNDLVRRVSEAQRQIEGWQERIVSAEEHNRRATEANSQTNLKIETLQGQQEASETRHSRVQVTITRIDQDLTRISSALPELFREDETQKERILALAEMLRRFETELDAVRQQALRITRIDDRLELVQAERSRHGERLNELTADMDQVKDVIDGQAERASVIEARIAGYQDDARALYGRLDEVRAEIVSYLRGLAELEGDFRKRQAAALEKESRDLRSRAIGLAEE